MTDIPIKPSPGTGLLKGTAYVVVLLLAIPAWISTTTWFSASQIFHISLFATGTFTFLNGSGYVLACLIVGWLCKRFGTGTVIMIGLLLSGIAALGYTVAPTWNLVEVVGFVAGLGNGLIFTGFIIHFAMRFGTRSLLWLFTYYSARELLMPFLSSTALSTALNWRSGFLVAAAVYGLAVIIFAVTRRLWNMSWFSETDEAESVRIIDILGLRLVWIAFAILILEGGLESAIYSYWPILVGNLGFNLGNMGSVALTNWRYAGVGAQFASLRILIFLERRINWRFIIWICAVGIIIGAGLATWGWLDSIRFAGNTLMVCFVAPLFPILLLYVKNQLPAAFLPITIGWLVAASTVGTDIISRIRGNSFSTTVNTMIVLVLIILIITGFEISGQLSRTKKKKISLEPPAFLPEEQ